MSSIRGVQFSFWMMWPLALVVFWLFIPASLWIEVKHYEATDAVSAEEVFILYDRDIDFNFPGGFTAAIRDSKGLVACPVGEGNLPYKTTATLPDPITLKWWLGHGECSSLPDGYYTLSTQWRVDTPLGLSKFTDTFVTGFTIESNSVEMEQNIVIENLSKRVEELVQGIEDSK